MRSIRKADTKPELAVRRFAHGLGYRIRLHGCDLPGTPDLVFPNHRKIVFVHGCFWHQHENCRLARLPNSRLDYLLPKFARNAERGRLAQEELRKKGWNVLMVWERETKDCCSLQVKLAVFLAVDRGG